MIKRIVRQLLILALVGGPVFAQSKPKFEVASIRPGCTRTAGGYVQSAPGRLTLNCVSLGSLIQGAYGAGDLIASGGIRFRMNLPIEGGPGWINDWYDIAAKAEGDASDEAMSGPMLQSLLEDRFRLKIHRETREVAGFALIAAKGGPKLQPSRPGGCKTYGAGVERQPGEHFCDRVWLSGMGSSLQVNFLGAPVESLARDLSYRLNRPVLDKTGLSGLFDFHLDFEPDQDTPTLHSAPAHEGTNIFTAIQEQLGLKLESRKVPGEILVIDSVERPSGN